jgi:hypothetical protein
VVTPPEISFPDQKEETATPERGDKPGDTRAPAGDSGY